MAEAPGSPLRHNAAAQPLDPWPGWRLDATGLLGGLLAGWLHWAIDFDATYWLITWTAIVMVSLLVILLRARHGQGPILTPVAQLPPTPPEAQKKKPRTEGLSSVKIREQRLTQLLGEQGQTITTFLLVLGVIGSLSSVASAFNRSFFDDADSRFATFTNPPRYAITAVDRENRTLTVDGDDSSLFLPREHLAIANSTGNDGAYVIASVTPTTEGLLLKLAQPLPDATADGEVRPFEREQLEGGATLEAAEVLYLNALKCWPWDGEAMRGLSQVQLHLASLTFQNDPAKLNEAVAIARRAWQRAMQAVELAPYDANAWYHLAVVDQFQYYPLASITQAYASDHIGRSIYVALQKDQVNNPSFYVLRVQALELSAPHDERWSQLVIATVKRFQEVYPPDQIIEYSKTRSDASWRRLPVAYLQLWVPYLEALEIEGNALALTEAIALARDTLLPAAETADLPVEDRKVAVTQIDRLRDAIARFEPAP